MPFREKSKKSKGNPSSSTKSLPPSSTRSQERKAPTPPSKGGGSPSPSPVDRENLTIDPREVVLVQTDSHTTLKKKSTLSKLRAPFKKDDPYKDWPENIYKPHELPRAKYRRPIDPDHQQTLQSYSLRNAFSQIRRRSILSQYSPMGSRSHSRRESFSSRHGRSAAPSRNHSIVEVLTESDINEAIASNVDPSRVLTIDLDGSTPSRNHSIAEIVNEDDIDDGDVSDVEQFLLLSDDEDELEPIFVRSRGNTLTIDDTIPDLVQSASTNDIVLDPIQSIQSALMDEKVPDSCHSTSVEDMVPDIIHSTSISDTDIKSAQSGTVNDNVPDLIQLPSDDNKAQDPIQSNSIDDTVPDLVQSTSIDSDYAESVDNASPNLSLGNLSRHEGLDDFVLDFGKPFDGEEFTRLLTEKLMTGERCM